MGNALPHIGAQLLVGEGAHRRAASGESVGGIVAVVDGRLQRRQPARLAVGPKLHESQLAAEGVDDDDVAVEDVVDVRGVVTLLAALADGDALEVTDGVEGGVAIEAAHPAVIARDVEAVHEVAQGIGHGLGAVGQRVLLAGAVGQCHGSRAAVDGDARQRTERNKRTRVLARVIIRALHQHRLRIEVA